MGELIVTKVVVKVDEIELEKDTCLEKWTKEV